VDPVAGHPAAGVLKPSNPNQQPAPTIMAIKLIANYSKRLGLPGYSSHQFSVSVETELVTTDDVAAESERLYQRLQSTVDEQMLKTGFVPPGTYGMEETNGSDAPAPGTVTQIHDNGRWKCSDKQKDLILKLVEEHQLDKADVDHLAHQRFGKGVKQLSKLEASGLIDELLDTYGGGRPAGNQSNTNRRNGSAYRGGANGRREAA
jgi:hypothetical protein